MAWRTLRHPNILSLLGVMMDNSLFLLAMASEWMVNGNINEYIRANGDADRFELVGRHSCFGSDLKLITPHSSKTFRED